MTIKDLQTIGSKRLHNKVFHPDLESDLLLAHVLKKDRAWLYAHPEKKISKPHVSTFNSLIRRRKRGEPFAYLVGQASFYGLEFKVAPDVLIPRPETEILVDEALRLLQSAKYGLPTVVDIGAGSGNIVISIAHTLRNLKFEISNLNFLAIDLSSQSLRLARQNARQILGPRQPIKFLKGNLLEPLIKLNPPHPWLVVANLPYLTVAETKKSELKFEPMLSLFGGKQGLELIYELLDQFAESAEPGDTILLEISAKQGGRVRRRLAKLMPRAQTKTIKDLADWERIIRLTIPRH